MKIDLEQDERLVNSVTETKKLSINFDYIETEVCEDLTYSDYFDEGSDTNFELAIADLYTFLRQEDESYPKNAMLGTITNDYLKAERNGMRKIERIIQNLLNLIDDEGRHLGILAVCYPIHFGQIDSDFNHYLHDYDYRDDAGMEKAFMRLSKEKKQKIRDKVKKIDEYYKSIGFYPVYSNFFLFYATYVYGDIGKQLSDISKKVTGEIEKLF